MILEYLEKENVFFKKIEEKYNEKIDSYHKTKNDFEKLVSDYFDKYAESKDMIYKNNVHNNKMYDIYSRIKGMESIKEKLYRKDMFSLNLEIDNEIMDKIDDLIGMKIITKSPNMVNFAKEIFEMFLKENNLSINNDTDVKSINKNGHAVFKYKIRFENCNFEIQIDSVFSNAWNEIEHTLFYKDYKYNIVKDNNKQIMNEIGDVVFKVDSLIGRIINNEIDYTKNNEKRFFENSVRYYTEKILKDNNFPAISNYYVCFTNFLILLCKDYEKISNILSNHEKSNESLKIDDEYKKIDNFLCEHSRKYIFFKNAYTIIMNSKTRELLKRSLDYKEFIYSYIAYNIIDINNQLDIIALSKELEDVRFEELKEKYVMDVINKANIFYGIYSKINGSSQYNDNDDEDDSCLIYRVFRLNLERAILYHEKMIKTKNENELGNIINSLMEEI